MANRDLVVIGGSAGSFPPLRALLRSFPADLPAAIAVVIHVPHDSIGVLTAVSPAGCELPVVHVEQGSTIDRGVVYVAPPNHHLLVRDGHFVLGNGPRENLARPAIDPLFRSAALEWGPRAIGVILSGRLDDGAAGLASIKDAGGAAVVQSPRDARVSEMPLAALRSTPVDVSADAADLGPAIERLVREPPGAAHTVSDRLAFEVAIAMGGEIPPEFMKRFTKPQLLTCPDCGGVMSQVESSGPLRFRCRVGHAMTGGALLSKQEGDVDEAVRVALRIIEERAELIARMGREAAEVGRPNMADLYERRSLEYHRQAETLRRALVQIMASDGESEGNDPAALEVHGASDDSEL
mgnify:CR=1 FL=1